MPRLPGLSDVLGAAVRAGRLVPGSGVIEAQLRDVERVVVRELRRRLDEAGDAAPRLPAGEDPVPAVAPPVASPAERLRELMRDSMQNTPADSRLVMHHTLLDELVPDEARILSALSDGSSYPLVHVAEPGVAGLQRRVLENASSVGRAAGVALPDRTHLYIGHLRRLGLVETAPEDVSMRDEYELLLTDRSVRAAITSVAKRPLGARVIRRTLRLSYLGRELWESAR